MPRRRKRPTRKWSKPSLQWDVKECARVTKHHRKLYDKLKKENDWTKTPPEVLQSMQSLHDYGYSLTDIGAMFGISRERVRQLFEVHGMRRQDDKGSSARLWNDSAGCFVPVTREQYLEAIKKAKLRYRRAQRRARRLKDIEYVQNLEKELGRPLSSGDLMKRGKYITLANRWGYRQRSGIGTYKDAIARLFRYAGVERKDRRHFTGRRFQKYQPEQILELRRRYSEGESVSQAAKAVGIKPSSAWTIVNFRTWKDIGEPKHESLHDPPARTGGYEYPRERADMESSDERRSA